MPVSTADFAKRCPAADTKFDLRTPAPLFTASQMEEHGRALAASHDVGWESRPNELLNRLSENEATLIEVRQLLADAAQQNRIIPPAGEWLLDNWYVVEEQIRTTKRHFP